MPVDPAASVQTVGAVVLGLLRTVTVAVVTTRAPTAKAFETVTVALAEADPPAPVQVTE